MNIFNWNTRAILLATVSLILMPITASAASDTATEAVGYFTFLDGSDWYGYHSTIVGSYSPTSLTGGKTVYAAFDYGGVYAQVYVSGFSSDPGSAWLSSVTCKGTTLSQGAPGAAFSYSATYGIAYWGWSSPFGLASALGTNVSCTIVHN
jgi:hypothetical protein